MINPISPSTPPPSSPILPDAQMKALIETANHFALWLNSGGKDTQAFGAMQTEANASGQQPVIQALGKMQSTTSLNSPDVTTLFNTMESQLNKTYSTHGAVDAAKNKMQKDLKLVFDVATFTPQTSKSEWSDLSNLAWEQQNVHPNPAYQMIYNFAGGGQPTADELSTFHESIHPLMQNILENFVYPKV